MSHMNSTERLADYKHQIDDDILLYGQGLLSETEAEYGPYSRDVVEAFVTILTRGSKRLRGALVMASYEMVGGTNKNMIIQAARAIEMIHAYLLMIDDIADRSDMRRKGPTAHVLMQRYHQDQKLKGDAAHFGTTVATYAAMLGAYQADVVVDKLDIPAETKLMLFRHVHRTLIRTYHGQLHDTFNHVLPNVTEKDALNVSELKTAYYSIASPLEVGALLGGAKSEDISILQRYGKPAGMAFQLTDDIMGIFGDEEQTGKSSLDDLREGKMTILMTHTLSKANTDQRQRLLKMLGNPKVSEIDLEECRKIVIDTGGLAYTRQQANDFSKDALKVLDDVPNAWDPALLQFLRELTLSFVTRQG